MLLISIKQKELNLINKVYEFLKLLLIWLILIGEILFLVIIKL